MDVWSYAGLSDSLLQMISEIKVKQAKFLSERGLSWEEVRCYCKERRAALQVEYQEWEKKLKGKK